MKINQLFLAFLLLFVNHGFAQDNDRVEVQGRIIVDRNDVEGVTVYNHTLQRGTVTDEEGNFIISVLVNDRIEFGALQFQNFIVIITDEIIASGEMTVHLVEKVNTLDEVVILPYGLTGNLNNDVSDLEIENPNLDALYFGLDNLDKIEFAPDHLSGVHNLAMEENRFIYGFNPLAIVGLALNAIFPPKKIEPYVPIHEKKTILSIYSIEHLRDFLNMQENELIEFVYFVEENDFDLTLLEPNNELQFLSYLKLKKKDFFDLKNDRN